MKRYDEYKQTGTPWIGEIPSHWEVIRLKNLIFLSSGLTLTSEEISDEGEYPVFGGNGIRGFYKNFNFDGERILIGRVGALCGNIHYTKSKFWGTEHVLVSNRVPGCTIPFDYEWFSYLLDSMNLNQYGIGSAQPVIAASTLENLKIPVPPLSEQEAIAAYLDKKCGSIDTVISTQERRIALLEELKQSVITEAVTHGINPDAKLRPSGIDWIGNIPEHWEKCRIKYLINYHSDGIWGDEEKGNEDDINCYRIADFDYNKMSIKNVIPTVRNISKDQKAGKQIFNGDLLLEKSGGGENSPVGRVVFANISEPAVCSNFIHFLRIENSATSRFLCYYFNFLYSNKVNLLFFNQTTGIQNLNLNDYLGQSLYIPPLREQEEIVKYIESKIKPIDASIAKAKREIELLKELKQSVITEAVTGKIKVC